MGEDENKRARDARRKELEEQLHQWKHDNHITKLIFAYFKRISDELTTSMVSLGGIDLTNEQKLTLLYKYSSKIEVLSEIMSIDAEVLLQMEEILRGRHEE